LPIRGEIAEQSPLISRIRHLGKVGRVLLDQQHPQQSTPAGDDSSSDDSLDEYRLFFDYLCEDYTAAAADLEALEARASSTEARLRILGLRAQVLHAQGQTFRARAIARYLVQSQGARSRQVEETPLGLVFSQQDDPARLWPLYLAEFTAEKHGLPSEALGDENDDANRQWARRGGFDARVFDGAGLLPFPRGQALEGFDPRPMGGPFRPERQPRFFPPPAPPRPVDPRMPRLSRPANNR
jgi:hypothetical protein